MRVAVATRSLSDELFALSGELLRLDELARRFGSPVKRHRFTGTDNVGYFRELLTIDADWVINIDEDAFLLSPKRLANLVERMEREGYAACGMPDGGVVGIRFHNPVGCNAYFNVFDLRRVRPVWRDWDAALRCRHRPEYERLVPAFARRRPHAFDGFQQYYAVFFALVEAGERFLYLDAEEWRDRVSTVLRDPEGIDFLIHCWYARDYARSYHTRRRYQVAIDHARRVQGLSRAPDLAAAESAAQTGNAGKWESRYQSAMEAFPYGDTLTYEKAARFLGVLGTVEDWGCGLAWFKRYLPSTVRYRGIDGSRSAFADHVADLTQYRSNADGVLLRHVLEHDDNWRLILDNAIQSFTKRLVAILFTPFAEVTHRIRYDPSLGVPDIAFAKEDLLGPLRDAGLRWELEENVATKTQYGVEHLLYVERP